MHADRWSYRSLLSRIKPRASARTARCCWHAAVCLWAAGRCTGSECLWSGQHPALSPAWGGNVARVHTGQTHSRVNITELLGKLVWHVDALTFIPLLSITSDVVGKAWLAATALEPVSSKTAFTEVVPTSTPRIKVDITADGTQLHCNITTTQSQHCCVQVKTGNLKF